MAEFYKGELIVKTQGPVNSKVKPRSKVWFKSGLNAASRPQFKIQSNFNLELSVVYLIQFCT